MPYLNRDLSAVQCQKDNLVRLTLSCFTYFIVSNTDKVKGAQIGYSRITKINYLFLDQTNGVGPQKNLLNETVLLSTEHVFNAIFCCSLTSNRRQFDGKLKSTLN